MDRLTDKDEGAGKGITGGVFKFSGAWGFKDERMRCKRLTAKDRTIIWNGGFKALGVDASIWELTVCFALLVASDTGDVAQDISESTAEDVALVVWHLQGFFDGIGEAVACETEVFEHGVGFDLLDAKFSSMDYDLPQALCHSVVVSKYHYQPRN